MAEVVEWECGMGWGEWEVIVVCNPEKTVFRIQVDGNREGTNFKYMQDYFFLVYVFQLATF